MNQPPRQLYFNRVQQLTQLIAARNTVIVAGRRTGKTHGISAPYVLRMVTRMPRSSGGIVVPTFKHGLTNTIPGVVAALDGMGYKKDLHYVIGQKPPADFATPYVPPQANEHVISFWNGSVAIMLSQDRPYAANSLTLSWLLIDEARFIDYEKLHNETFPALGGSRAFFENKSCWNSKLILSDMPQTQRGSWFLRYADDMNPELIDMIKATVYEEWRLAQLYKERPTPELLRRIKAHDLRLNQMRSLATFYAEFSTIENLQLLGEDYIRQMKRDLTPKTFQTSILCKRIGIARDGFYSTLRESLFYDASDVSYLEERFMQGLVSGVDDSRADSDVNPDKPICIGMDYNANINCLVSGQPDSLNSRLNVLRAFFVKFDRKLPELIADFCKYYRHHRNKTVIFYYDATALGRNSYNNSTPHSIIMTAFKRHGWTVRQVYLGVPMQHHQKYLLINEAFQSRQSLTPYFNRIGCDALIIAMQRAEVERGRNGFKKDKSKEKKPETEESLLEHRTDITDAFDTLAIGCLTQPAATVVPFVPSFG